MAPARGRLDALRAVAAPVLRGVPGPAAVVDPDGWVAAVSAVLGTDRVAVPVEGGAASCPASAAACPSRCRAAGCCAPTRPGGPIRLRLDLASRPPHAVVEGSTVWRYPLTPRHAQLLAC